MKILITSLILLMMSNANADYYEDNYSNRNESDYAQVVNVQTVYETYQVPQNRTVCNNNIRSGNRKPHRRNQGGAIIGGIIGGLIGNQFGKGHGKDASTVAGVIAGAAVGSQARPGNGHHARPQCYTTTEYYQEQRIKGYDVSYDYNGRVYQTRMQNHPGDRVRVIVSVQVAGY